jgi:hypothetical protein
MSSGKRVRALKIAGALVFLLSPAPAEAAPPSNDAFAGAEAIRSLPFSETLDTSEATLDADDASLELSSCVAGDPSTFRHSVWYAYTPPEDQTVVVSAVASHPGATGVIVMGRPGAFSRIPSGCLLGGGTQVELAAHTTYHIVVALPDFGSASTLRLALDELRPFQTAVTINPNGRWVVGTGVLTGTMSCFPGLPPTMTLTLGQRGPRNTTIVGANEFSPEPFCDETPQPWTIIVAPFDAPFKPGNASATLRVGELLDVTRRVKLRREHSGPGSSPPEHGRRPRDPEPA